MYLCILYQRHTAQTVYATMPDSPPSAEEHELTPNEIAARLATEVPITDQLHYSDALHASNHNNQAVIRLLHLHPGTGNTPITGDLQTVELASAPPFEALSYCWGPPEPKYSICIEGATLSVTENLKLALFRLRHADRVRALWIDGICINQQDDVEKSYQVGLMRDIYLQAKETVVWLGEEADGSRLALDLCSRMIRVHGNTFVKENLGVDVKELYRKQEQEENGKSKEAFAEALDLDHAAFEYFLTAGDDAGCEQEPSAESKDLLQMSRDGTLESHFIDVGRRVAAGETYDGPHKELVYKAVAEFQAEAAAKVVAVDEVDEVEEELAKMVREGTYYDHFREAGRMVARGEEYTGICRDLVYEGHAEAVAELEEERRQAESSAARGKNAGAAEVDRVDRQSADGDGGIFVQAGLENSEQEADGNMSHPTTTTRFHERLVLQILNGEETDTSQEPPTSDEVKALQALVRRAWFRRIWIVQEAGVSEAIVVQCGSSTVDWWTFCYGYLITTRLNRAMLLGPMHYRNILLMSATRQSLQHAVRRLRHTSGSWMAEASRPDLDLLHLLHTYRQYLATDPRDKVFALLGIARSDSQAAVMTIDYQQKLPVIYTQVAKALLTSAASAHLDLFGVAKGHGQAADLTPSWAPDWSDSERMPYPLAGDHNGGSNSGVATPSLRVFSASGPTTTNVTFTDADRLRLRGRLFDRVTELGDSMHIDEANLDLLNPENGPDATGAAAISYLRSVFGMLGSTASTLRQWLALAKYDCEPTTYFAGKDKATRYVRNVWKGLAKVGVKSYKYPTGEDNFSVFVQTLWTDMKTPTENMEKVREWLSKMRTVEYLVGILPSFDFEPTEENLARFYKQMGPALRILRSEPLEGAGVACVHVLERRMARTSKGYLCLVPAGTRVGDEVVLLQGGRTPYILRGTFAGRILVGEAYVHGIMYGEAWDEEACGEVVLI